jgi:obg-like ATPase 1
MCPPLLKNYGMYKKVETELAEVPLEERVEYLKSLGVAESGLGNLVKVTYNLLG